MHKPSLYYCIPKSSRIFYTAFIILIIITVVTLYLVYPSVKMPYETGKETDFPVLLAAILTLVISMVTLLVSWFIKQEAEGIGDSIITNAVIHRYLDRMLHEYSMTIDLACSKLRATFVFDRLEDLYNPKTKSEVFSNYGTVAKIARLTISVNVWKWFNEFTQQYGKDNDIYFFEKLMPGKIGEEFKDDIGFKNLKQKIQSAKPPENILEIYSLVDHVNSKVQSIIEIRALLMGGKEDYEEGCCQPLEIAKYLEKYFHNTANDIGFFDDYEDSNCYVSDDVIDKELNDEEAIVEKINDNYNRMREAIKKLNEISVTTSSDLDKILESDKSKKIFNQSVTAASAIFNMMKGFGWKLNDYALERFLSETFRGEVDVETEKKISS